MIDFWLGYILGYITLLGMFICYYIGYTFRSEKTKSKEVMGE